MQETNQRFGNISCEEAHGNETELGRIFASLSQFDIFVLKKLHHLHQKNDTDGPEHGSLSYNVTKMKMLSNDLNYEDFAFQFCQMGNECDINLVQHDISAVVYQLMLVVNGWAKMLN